MKGTQQPKAPAAGQQPEGGTTPATPAQPAAEPQNKNLADDPAFQAQSGQVAALTAQLRQTKRDALKTAMQGRIPEAKQPLALSLADSLPLDASIDLADGDGNPVKRAPLDLLIDMVSAIPQPVQPGQVSLGDLPAVGDEKVDLDMGKLLSGV